MNGPGVSSRASQREHELQNLLMNSTGGDIFNLKLKVCTKRRAEEEVECIVHMLPFCWHSLFLRFQKLGPSREVQDWHSMFHVRLFFPLLG